MTEGLIVPSPTLPDLADLVFRSLSGFLLVLWFALADLSALPLSFGPKARPKAQKHIFSWLKGTLAFSL